MKKCFCLQSCSSVKEFATYKYNITNGHVKTTVPYSGSFVLNGGHSGVVTEEY